MVLGHLAQQSAAALMKIMFSPAFGAVPTVAHPNVAKTLADPAQ
jgi:hypothetical protein